jgi:hypothetical protein
MIKTTYPDLRIEGEKEQDKWIEPITSDMRRDPSAWFGKLTTSRAGERNCDRVRANHKRAEPFCGPGPSQMPVDVLSEIRRRPPTILGPQFENRNRFEIPRNAVPRTGRRLFLFSKAYTVRSGPAIVRQRDLRDWPLKKGDEKMGACLWEGLFFG